MLIISHKFIAKENKGIPTQRPNDFPAKCKAFEKPTKK